MEGIGSSVDNMVDVEMVDDRGREVNRREGDGMGGVYRLKTFNGSIITGVRDWAGVI